MLALPVSMPRTRTSHELLPCASISSRLGDTSTVDSLKAWKVNTEVPRDMDATMSDGCIDAGKIDHWNSSPSNVVNKLPERERERESVQVSATQQQQQQPVT